ncbi:MFS transporter [Streptoalloteichus hindustanus]|uniref:Drug resistance transporter, EmrB/QacA subfamily n=1 Tax=Streptoalloteichus hindustanus TaxID=2017 RepID=A0A1M5I7W8_STRHI|nr:MFS transporter [Streptoalloteichus hindustanus]SHG24352.1 drug resistance transporter, EmrB/QacA subfamily [Streptoalloteichus hindustanus]
MTLQDAESQIAAPDTAPPESRRRWALVLIAGALALDTSGAAVINAALPSIGDEYGIDSSTLQWTMTAYSIAFAGFLMFGGRIADVLGRRKIFAVGVALFAAASLGAALAPTVGVLIAARALQGVGAALSGPASLGLLSQIFPEGPQRNRALAVYAATGASSFSAGLVVGGALTDFLGWRSVFAVSVLAGALILAGVRALLPAGRRQPRPLDVPGAILVTLGIGLVVYGVSEGSAVGWGSAQVVCSLVLAVIGLVAFVVWEKGRAEPLLPMSVFRSRPVRAASLTGAVFYTGAGGLLFFSPLYAQGILGYSPFESALAVLPVGVVVVISSQIAGRLMSPAAYKPLMAASLLLIGTGVALWVGTPENGSYWVHMLPGIVIMSTGQGLGFGAMTAATLEGLPLHQHGVAGAVNVTAQQIGNSVGLAILVAVSTGVSGGATTPADQLSGFHAAYWVAGAIGLLGGLAVLLTRFPKVDAAPSTSEEETVTARAGRT